MSTKTQPPKEVGQPTESTDQNSQVEELETLYKRALADYQNLVKQTAKERQEYIKYANSTLIASLLPLLDNLEMAHRHLQDPGLDMIVKQFKQTLIDEGLIPIHPAPGDQFDEQYHEAIDTFEIETQDQVAGTIAEVSLTGYRWHEGTVIRHAKVKVFQDKNHISN